MVDAKGMDNSHDCWLLYSIYMVLCAAAVLSCAYMIMGYLHVLVHRFVSVVHVLRGENHTSRTSALRMVRRSPRLKLASNNNIAVTLIDQTIYDQYLFRNINVVDRFFFLSIQQGFVYVQHRDAAETDVAARTALVRHLQADLIADPTVGATDGLELPAVGTIIPGVSRGVPSKNTVSSTGTSLRELQDSE